MPTAYPYPTPTPTLNPTACSNLQGFRVLGFLGFYPKNPYPPSSGGALGLHKRKWDARQLTRDDCSMVELRYESPQGEGVSG